MNRGRFTVDIDGVIGEWDQGMELLTGFTRDEVVGKPCTDLRCSQCTQNNCPFGFGGLAAFSKSDEESVETCLRHRGGAILPVLKCSRPVMGADGEVTAGEVQLEHIAAAEEASELARLRAELRDLRRLIEARLEDSPAALDPKVLPPGFKLPGTRYRKAQALREELLEALIACRWNKSEVARTLGITRVSVWRRMKQLGLPLEPPGNGEAVEESEDSRGGSPGAGPPGPPAKPASPLDLSWD